MLVEQFLRLLISAVRTSKVGVLFIALAVLIVFALLVLGFASLAGDLLLMASARVPMIHFLETGWGVVAAAVSAVILALLGTGFLLFLKPHASQAETTQPETSPQTDPEEVEQLKQENEELRQKLDEGEQKRFERLRDFFANFDYDNENILETGPYSQIKPDLDPEIRERLQNPRELHFEIDNRTGGDVMMRGQSPNSVKTLLLDEVARLEREGTEHNPRTPGALSRADAEELEELRAENERLKRQATPPPLSELKPLCLHLAEELEWEVEIFQDGERSIILWVQELEEQGLSENEIEGKRRDAELRVHRETMDRYKKRHKDRLLNLYDALGQREWFSTSDRGAFENPKSSYSFSNLAKRLREVCGKWPDS